MAEFAMLHFTWCNCRKEPHTALPVSTFSVFNQIWQIMQTEDDLGQFADLTIDFLFSLWVSFLLAQQAVRLACVPCEAAPSLIFFLFYSGETREKLVNSGR